MPKAASADKPDWSPPKSDDSGHELFGDYPVSGPARALALHKAGRKTDPDGLLTPEQIAAVSSGDMPKVGEDGSAEEAPARRSSPPRARTAAKGGRATARAPAKAPEPPASTAPVKAEPASAKGSDA